MSAPSSPRTSTTLPPPSSDLPTLLPLSHAHPLLSPALNPSFDPSEFLLSRPHVGLQDLEDELAGYAKTLKDELVGVVDEDYQDFISLSLSLRDEGPRLERIEEPLGGMRDTVETARSSLADIRRAVQEKLDERSKLREEKALLRLLMQISDSLTRLEGLLHIGPSPAEPSTASTNTPKRVERIAAEYTHLLYLISKASAAELPFVSSVQWRIDRLTSTLLSTLSTLLTSTLQTLIPTPSSFTTAPASLRSAALRDLSDLLRTYDSLSRHSEAASVLRSSTIAPFLSTVIHSTALQPLPPQPDSLLSPTTPKTPFLRTSGDEPPSYFGAAATAAALDADVPQLNEEDGENLLAALYNKILSFVAHDLRPILQAAEKDDSSFDFFAGVLWDETARRLSDTLGGTIFAVGRTTEFHARYTTTQAFLSHLESLAPTLPTLHRLRAHPALESFLRRFQLPVYFQLRLKEALAVVEGALAAKPQVIPAGGKNGQWGIRQSERVSWAVGRSWSDEVWVDELGGRFWRLTLQLLSRYKGWLEKALPEAPASASTDRLNPSSAASTRAPSPNPLSTTQPAGDERALEDASLKLLSLFHYDLDLFISTTRTLWSTSISTRMPSDPAPADDIPSPHDVLIESLDALAALKPRIEERVLAILFRRAAEPLRLLKSSLYRTPSAAATGAAEPSYFIENVMRPVKVFFGEGGAGEGLKESVRSEWSAKVFEEICVRYATQLTAMKKTEESLRRYKMGTKGAGGGLSSLFSRGKQAQATAQPDAGAGAGEEDKVAEQMQVDVRALGEDARALGVDLDGVGEREGLKGWKELREVVGMGPKKEGEGGGEKR